MKNKEIYIIIAFAILLLFVLKKFNGVKTKKRNDSPEDSDCVNPKFPELFFSGRDCAGSVIDENRKLKVGNYGCDVLILQQRLNNIDRVHILEPNGFFDCATLEKLRKIKGVSEIALNEFQVDEQTGTDGEPTKAFTNYSYMNVR